MINLKDWLVDWLDGYGYDYLIDIQGMIIDRDLSIMGSLLPEGWVRDDLS